MADSAAVKLIEEARLKRDKQLGIDFRKTFSSAAGQNVLRWLMMECGFQSQSVVANKQTQEIYVDSTIYNEARRNLYLQMRRFLPPHILIPVEIDPPEAAKQTITKKEGSHVKRNKTK